jgi:hypothetical protein
VLVRSTSCIALGFPDTHCPCSGRDSDPPCHNRKPGRLLNRSLLRERHQGALARQPEIAESTPLTELTDDLEEQRVHINEPTREPSIDGSSFSSREVGSGNSSRNMCEDGRSYSVVMCLVVTMEDWPASAVVMRCSRVRMYWLGNSMQTSSRSMSFDLRFRECLAIAQQQVQSERVHVPAYASSGLSSAGTAGLSA